VSLGDRAALRLFQEIAGKNRDKMERRDGVWQGLAFALSPQDYGRKSGVRPDLT